MDSRNQADVQLPVPSQLPELFSLGHLQPQQVQSIPPIALAYIGDAVFELYVRMKLLWPPQRIHMFHQQVVGQVKAEQQAAYLDILIPELTDAETDVMRRGRNATSKSPRRLPAKIYRQATAFETLVGYLYITDKVRLYELLNKLSVKAAAH